VKIYVTGMVLQSANKYIIWKTSFGEYFTVYLNAAKLNTNRSLHKSDKQLQEK